MQARTEEKEDFKLKESEPSRHAKNEWLCRYAPNSAMAVVDIDSKTNVADLARRTDWPLIASGTISYQFVRDGPCGVQEPPYHGVLRGSRGTVQDLMPIWIHWCM